MNEKLLRRVIHGVPQQVRDFMRSFQRSGFQIYLVGGAVRNLILGHLPSDFDFATNATPDAVRSAFPRVIPTGIQHGTVTVIFRGEHYEVTTYRTEGPYTDSRRPDHVEFVGDIHADLSRRDFTMNAMALDPVGTLFLDPHDGEQDIHDRVIRAVPAIPPFRACTAKRSMYVLELPAGSIERTQTTAGDQVQIRAAADTRATSFAVPNAAASAPPA